MKIKGMPNINFVLTDIIQNPITMQNDFENSLSNATMNLNKLILLAINNVMELIPRLERSVKKNIKIFLTFTLISLIEV